MNTAIILVASALIVLSVFLLSRKISQKATNVILIVLAFFYVAVVQVRHCLPDSFVFVIKGGGMFEDVYYEGYDPLQSILRWGLGINAVVAVTAIYCKNKFFRNLSIVVCLPFAVVSSFFYGDFMRYFLADGVRKWQEQGVVIPEIVRHIQFSLELILAIALPLLTLVVQKHIPFRSKKQILPFFLGIIPVAVVCVPMLVPQSLFGYTSIVMGGFSERAILYLSGCALAAMTLYFSVRFTDYDTRYSVCFFLALTATHFFTEMYIMGHTVSRIGLFQLCNLANYLLLICIVFKWKQLFDFMLLANTLGAMIAFCVPDVNAGLFEPWNFHFILNHTLIMFCPALFMALRIFPRPNRKSIKHCFVGYCIFFGTCFVLGTIINGAHSAQLGYIDREVNYFYLFDHDRILGVLKFMRWTVKWKIVIAEYWVIYPIWIAMFFGTYFGGTMLIYLMVKKLCKIADEHFALRADRLLRRQQKTGKPSKYPLYYSDDITEDKAC